MKKWYRLTALVLAFAIVLSTVSGALAQVEVNYGDYQTWVEDTKAANGLAGVISIDEGGEVLVEPSTFTGETNAGPQYTTQTTQNLGSYAADSAPTIDVVLEQYGKVTLAAPAAGQWQAYLAAADLWVDITGETGSTFALTFAKVQSLFMANGHAQLRCKMGDAVTETVNVGMSYAMAVLPANTQEDTAATLMMAKSSGNDGIALAADEPELGEYSIVINYVFENNEIVADPYTATLAAGSKFSDSVNHPIIMGYLPYVGNETETSTKIDINVTNIQADVTYIVTYKPTNVDYTVIHYWQNVDNDNYTEHERETLQGLTNSVVSEGNNLEVANEYPGFYALLYEKPKIASDGSTVVEIYYDRYYYLMNFDLDGGYGVDPIYARFGTTVSVNNPSKTGYTFGSWSPDVPATVPVDGGTYKAIWTNPQTVDYTIVYWRENANDNGYSFWKQDIAQAVAGTSVNGSDSLSAADTRIVLNEGTDSEVTVTEKNYFTYNDLLTDKNVVINGDGSSVVNVYYTRNVYRMTFYYNGDCKLEAHTHTDACWKLACDIEEHDHEEDGCGVACGKTAHVHSDSCCTATHTHTKDCYSNVGNVVTKPSGAPSNPKEGQVYRTGSFPNYTRYIYIAGNWYQYSQAFIDNGTIIDPNCEGEHIHNEGACNCTQEVHVHSDACYDCGKTEHAHTQAACYKVACGKIEHTHSNANCQYGGNNYETYGYRIFKVIEAKYDEDISNEWPTATDVNQDGFNGWVMQSAPNSVQTSKVVTMTYDICDTSDRLNKAYASYQGSCADHLYYMFESFDQTSPENGNDRIRHENGKYYDKSTEYSQNVNSNGGGWTQKKISGMEAVNTETVIISSYYGTPTERNVFLYYNRLRFTLTYMNVSDTAKVVSNVMYEQPLANYKDSSGNLLSAYVLTDNDYPIEDLRGLYKFKGWYTTPECYEGTEFNISTATMPNGDLTVYAKWAPIDRKVEFYLDYDAYVAETKIGENYPDLIVPNGSKVETVPATPTNGSYKFVGWFYMDNGEEKAFDFANMPINRDMKVYGKWSSDVLKNYFVYFKIQGTDTEIADPITGSALAGNTKTFDAKGGTELYAGYQEGYFPLVQSHSMTIDIENDANNIYTFEYVQKSAVPYTVYYVAEKLKDGEDATKYHTIERDGKTYYIIADTYTNSENRKAVVTEKFKAVTGYMPDAYQKRLIVDGTDGAVNEIIFYYSVDTKHAYYKITHYTQNTDGETWTEYASSEAVGDINSTYSADPLTIDGFTFDSSVEGTLTSGVLTANGLELKLYYVRNPYPYEVRYLKQGTGEELAKPKTGSDLYGKVISESAIDITNYTPVAPTTQTLTIKKEESTDVAELNIIYFYYKENEVTINYVVVGPTGCGSVTRESETVKVLTGTAQGSVAAANETYRFVGWYTDKDCKNSVTAADGTLSGENNETFVPAKEPAIAEKKDDEGNIITPAVPAMYESATFYAKFEYNLTTLTIHKDGTNTTLDAGQSYLFRVKGYGLPEDGLLIAIKEDGSETISGLTVGQTYTVTEDENWSWRYTVDSECVTSITLAATGNEITIDNKRDKNQWLSGDCYAENIFGEASN